MRIQCTCPTCGASFSRFPTRKQVYCRPECRPAKLPLIEHFWVGVDKNGPVPTHRPELGPCWVWTRAKLISFGYGAFWDGNKVVRAHRFSWELERGPIPDGLRVLHHCDNPPCVRPSHLFVGTSQDNVDDMFAKGRMGGWNTDRSLAHHGETHHSAIATEAQVRVVRLRAASGEMQTEIARDMGLTTRIVNGIVLRRTWKHVT